MIILTTTMVAKRCDEDMYDVNDFSPNIITSIVFLAEIFGQFPNVE